MQSGSQRMAPRKAKLGPNVKEHLGITPLLSRLSRNNSAPSAEGSVLWSLSSWASPWRPGDIKPLQTILLSSAMIMLCLPQVSITSAYWFLNQVKSLNGSLNSCTGPSPSFWSLLLSLFQTVTHLSRRRLTAWGIIDVWQNTHILSTEFDEFWHTYTPV